LGYIRTEITCAFCYIRAAVGYSLIILLHSYINTI